MKQFVPISDELIFDHPDRISGPLVPFSHDYDCYHWLDGIETKNISDKDISHDNKNNG